MVHRQAGSRTESPVVNASWRVRRGGGDADDDDNSLLVYLASGDDAKSLSIFVHMSGLGLKANCGRPNQGAGSAVAVSGTVNANQQFSVASRAVQCSVSKRQSSLT